MALRFLLVLATLLLCPVYTPAEGLPPDTSLLSVKGYSPEVTYNTERQRLRQEWKPQYTPYRSRWQQFKQNLIHNDWTGSLQEFGAPSLREYQ